MSWAHIRYVHGKRGVEPVECLRRAAGNRPPHNRGSLAHRATGAGSRASTAASAVHTWSTCASVISGKNGNAIVDALMASVTGQRDRSVPERSW